MAFNAASFSEKLRQLDISQPSVTKLSQYIQFQQSVSRALRGAKMISLICYRSFVVQHIEAIAEAWLQACVCAPIEHLLGLIYLVGDVLLSSKSKGTVGQVFASAFLRVLPVAIAVVGSRGLSIAPKVQRLISVWRERGVFNSDEIASLHNALDDPDSFDAALGVNLLGATLGVVQASATSPGTKVLQAARSDNMLTAPESSAPFSPLGFRTAHSKDPMQFYGTGFSSDSSIAASSIPVVFGEGEESAKDWEASAKIAEARASLEAKVRLAEAEKKHEADVEAFAAARAATPLTVIELAVAELSAARPVVIPVDNATDSDPLLLSFEESLAMIDRAEGKCRSPRGEITRWNILLCMISLQTGEHPCYTIAAEIATSLEGASDTLVEAANAFCVEDETIAGAVTGEDEVASDAGLSKAELLAQSVPYDPSQALLVIKV
jgi:hypothetical protein